MSDDAFGDMNADPDVEMRRRLPEKLRELFVCDYDPTSLDHGHTLCYFVELAAREIERLRLQLKQAELQRDSRLYQQGVVYIPDGDLGEGSDR